MRVLSDVLSLITDTACISTLTFSTPSYAPTVSLEHASDSRGNAMQMNAFEGYLNSTKSRKIRRMNQSTYIADLVKMEDNESEHSDIAEFYSGCNILVTDATDFVNKLIIEKLLRSCPNLQKLFVLVKPKPGVPYKNRLTSTFDDPLYARLRLEHPDFKSRVTLIDGDSAASEFGLSSTSRDFLQKNTHVVIHKPASARRDEKLRRAVDVNVGAVKSMLQLAAEMPDLKAFVYVSSAFAHHPNNYVNERFYNSRKSAEKVLSLVKVLDDNLLNYLATKIIGKWPNATTFCQCLAEEMVQIYGNRLPTCIVRSAITLSTLKEPVCGYVDESHEITKSLASTALGVVRVLSIDGHCNAEVVPADFVVNNVLAAAWDVNRTWSTSKERMIMGEMEPTIYNCVLSCEKAINWDRFVRLNQKFASEEPSTMTFWYHYLVLVNHKWLYKFYTALLHLLPAIIIDAFTQPMDENLKLSTTYEKIHKASDSFAYYGSKQWVFGNSNVSELWKKMSFADRNKFDFNIAEFDWEEYMQYYTRALRIGFFKDPMLTLKQARRRYQRMKIAHYTLGTFLCFAFACIVGSLFKILNFI